jgi:aminoglycoside phosphotransferase (APT) family kinase protein
MLFDHKGVTYLVMDAISGHTLQAVVSWMEPTALQKTAQQLRKAVDELQSLTLDFPSPCDNYYGQWPGTSFAHHNKRFKFKDTVPNFRTLQDLLSYILSSPSDKTLTTVLERELTGNATRAVLTHGDLAPHNIMVDKVSGDILGILDWEMFGWYPAYWERMFVLKSCAHARLRNELERTFDGAL